MRDSIITPRRLLDGAHYTGTMPREPWRCSLHGGHSGEFCEHAEGRLEDVLDAAVTAGYHTFGVTEHAPRTELRFLYPTEKEKGFTVERLEEDFRNYIRAIHELANRFAERLIVLRGFEIEVVPTDGYRDKMLAYREAGDFDYMVGSVHYVDEVSIDGEIEDFHGIRDGIGGLEALAVRYYETVAEMIDALRPEVVGHLDLLRKNAGPDAPVDTPLIRRAADRALEAARACEAILDLNTAGYRKGLPTPYPAPWLVERAAAMGIGFCFGDDSHGPAQVGAGIDDARDYLLANGVREVTVLTRTENSDRRGTVEKRTVRLSL